MSRDSAMPTAEISSVLRRWRFTAEENRQFVKEHCSQEQTFSWLRVGMGSRPVCCSSAQAGSGRFAQRNARR